jgi:hypothetical protein
MRYPDFGEGGRARRARLIAVTLFSVQPALAGCQGTIGDWMNPGTTTRGSPDADIVSVDGGPPSVDGGTPPSSCEPTPRPSQRVTLRSELQFANGLRDLLGSDVLAGATGVPAPEGRTLDLDLVNQMSPKSLATRYGFVLAAGDRASGAVRTVAPCSATQTPTACAEAVARVLVERAFRRPVGAEELADLMNVYKAGAATSHDEGIRWMVEAIAFAPSSMYTREIGTPSSDKEATLSSWEIADLLGLFFLESIPDAELARAARAGELIEPAAIEAQASRLLGLPSVQENLSQTVISFLQAARIFGVVKDPKFAEFSKVQASMYKETSLFVDDSLWKTPRAIPELLTTTRTFVDPGLASLYGVAYPGAAGQQDFLPVDLPTNERAGFLTQAGLLSIKSAPNTTSVIFRGLFVRGSLLCLPDISPPSDPATQAKIAAQQANQTLTERDKAQFRKTTTPCSGCHGGFDPFGLSLESYDAIGRYRTKDEAGRDVDPSIDLSAFEPILSGSVPNAVALARKIAESGRFQSCLSERILSYAMNAPLTAESCDVRDVALRTSQAGNTVPAMARAIAASPAMRTRTRAGQGGQP